MNHEALAGKTAVLLINLGSPEAPTKQALRPYLREFLSDPRVIDLPRWQWLPILYGIVLNTRPKKSAQAYEQIWWDEGAPLIVISERQVAALEERFVAQGLDHVVVDYAMRYGQPSIDKKMTALAKQGVERVLVVPMYPQYADATTASVFDGVAMALEKQRNVPELRFVRSWHDHPLYINALADSIQRHFDEYGQPQKLLFSFHGVPKRYLLEGDPYFCQCHKTTRLVVEALGLAENDYQLVFQSRFGREEWLQPYADKTIAALPAQGIESVSVICPGFSADCLETLEEMAIGNRNLFLENGGKRYDYIPCLNEDPAHIDLLSALVRQHTQGWAAFDQGLPPDDQAAQKALARRAQWEETQKVAR
ncbi:ferrochelatase [Suttonella sp. R2A3]|uniref:ferrochelatase n=1 Tax=Suttonella sp. R2A3 TaxID=2908648 RepID=UPI001F157AA5|nr:ferrochelatase [Suttonella sp. R2A3]UJF25098.1 ferrochelatase [Suttonella sp. R2A3]